MTTSDVKAVFRLGGKFIPVGTKVSGATFVGQPGRTFSFTSGDFPAVYSFTVANNLASGIGNADWDPMNGELTPDGNAPLEVVDGGEGLDCEGLTLPQDPARLLVLYEFTDDDPTHRCFIKTADDKLALAMKPGSAVQMSVYDEEATQQITIDNPGGSLTVSVIALGV